MNRLETNPRNYARASGVTEADLDAWLSAQLIVAWAGEGRGLPASERRLGWWRSDMVSEFGGEDLYKRLLPRTAAWSVYQTAQEAARRTDAQARAQSHDSDQILSLFHLGFELDERVAERLRQHKHSGKPPSEALPALGALVAEGWDRARFLTWIEDHGSVRVETSSIGRRLVGAAPAKVAELVGQLVAGLVPLGAEYPLPHYRREA